MTVRMGDCPQRQPIGTTIAAYESFDRHEPGWLKVELMPSTGKPTDGSVRAERLVTA